MHCPYFLNRFFWAQNIFGNVGDDVITGDARDNWLSGGAGSDTLRGGDGDDILIIDADDKQENIDGGAGYDLVKYQGNYKDYKISRDGANYKIEDLKLLTILRKKLSLYRLIKTLQTKPGFMFISDFISALTFSRFFGNYNFCYLRKNLHINIS